MNPISKTFSNSLYVLLANLTEKAVFFVLFAVMAREFNKEGYGYIVSCFALGNIASSFFDFGFAFYFQREAAAGSKEFFSRLYSAVLFRLCCWVPFILVVLLYSASLEGSMVSLLIITTSAFLFGLNNDLSAVLNGRMNYKDAFATLAKARIVLLLSFALFYYVFSGSDILLISFLLSAIVHFVLLYKKVIIAGRGERSFSFAPVKAMILLAMPIGLGFIANWVYDKVDVLVIGNIMDLESVAIYAAAYSVFKLPQSVGNSIINPLYTSFSADFSASGKILFSKYKSEIYLLLGFSCAALIVIHLGSDLIITLIYSEKYSEGGMLLKLLAVGVPFMLMNNVTGIALNAMRKDIQVTLVVAIAGLGNIALNIYFLMSIGIMGAVYATIITEAVILMVQIVLILKIMKGNR